MDQNINLLKFINLRILVPNYVMSDRKSKTRSLMITRQVMFFPICTGLEKQQQQGCFCTEGVRLEKG